MERPRLGKCQHLLGKKTEKGDGKGATSRHNEYSIPNARAPALPPGHDPVRITKFQTKRESGSYAEGFCASGQAAQ